MKPNNCTFAVKCSTSHQQIADLCGKAWIKANFKKLDVFTIQIQLNKGFWLVNTFLLNIDRTPELSQTTVYFCQTTVELITVKQDKCCSRNWSHSSAEKKRPCLFESSEALCPKLSWSWDWCKINPGEKIQQVTSIFWDTWNNKDFYRSPGNDFPLLLSSMQYAQIESMDNLNKWGRLSIPAEAHS